MRHRTANLRILQRVLALDVRVEQFVAELVHAEKDRSRIGSVQRLDALGAFQPRPILHGYREDEIEIARNQRRCPGRVLTDRRKDHLIDIGLEILVPVAAETLECRLHVRLAGGDDEGTGTIFVGRGVGGTRIGVLGAGRLGRVVRLGPLLVHHVVEGQVARQDRVGGRRRDDDRVVVDLLDVRDLGPNAFRIGTRR